MKKKLKVGEMSITFKGKRYTYSLVEFQRCNTFFDALKEKISPLKYSVIDAGSYEVSNSISADAITSN